jgi:hypothetical protein
MWIHVATLHSKLPRQYRCCVCVCVCVSCLKQFTPQAEACTQACYKISAVCDI